MNFLRFFILYFLHKIRTLTLFPLQNYNSHFVAEVNQIKTNINNKKKQLKSQQFEMASKKFKFVQMHVITPTSLRGSMPNVKKLFQCKRKEIKQAKKNDFIKYVGVWGLMVSRLKIIIDAKIHIGKPINFIITSIQTNDLISKKSDVSSIQACNLLIRTRFISSLSLIS